MSNIIRSQSQALSNLQSRSPIRRVSREGMRRVREEAEEAVAAATRVEGTAYLTHMAMTHLATLSTMESTITESVPASDPIQKDQVARRTSLLVDNYTATVASEIAKRGV